MSIKREGIDKSKFQSIINGLGNYEGRVGWDESAVYPNGTKTAQVAAIMELGDPDHNIPPRSYMRSTMTEKDQEWKDKAAKLAKSVIKGKRDALDAFTLLVQVAEGDIVEKITTIQEPPLKEETVEARLRKRKDKNTVGNLRKPLIDTGYMLSTFTSKVS